MLFIFAVCLSDGIYCLAVRGARGQRVRFEPMPEWGQLPPILPQQLHLHMSSGMER